MGNVYTKLGGEKIIQSDPILITKNITANGSYYATNDNADGYSSVNVAVPDPTRVNKTITANGTYNAQDDNAYGYNQVVVNVPSLKTIPCTFTWRKSGQLISVNLSGYSYIIMKVRNVFASSMSSYGKNIYICMPTNNEVVYSGWKSTHDAGGGNQYTGNVVCSFHANSNGVYIDSFSNSDTRAVYESLTLTALYGIK